MKREYVISLGVLGLAALIFFCAIHVVPAGHRGIQVTFGKVSTEPYPEGLSVSTPWSSVRDVPIQQQTANGEAACFSSDLQTVQIKYALLYRIPAEQVVTLYQKYKGDPYDTLAEPRVQECLKQVTATYTAEQIVQKREEVREKALAKIKISVGGLIEIVDMNVVNIDLTKELETAIEAKMVQQQQSLAKAFELDREKKQAEITIVQAKAEAESVKLKGDALASSPKVIELEIVKKWDGKSPQTLVVGAGGGASVVFPVGQGSAPTK